jgi:hypothetical protein
MENTSTMTFEQFCQIVLNNNLLNNQNNNMNQMNNNMGLNANYNMNQQILNMFQRMNNTNNNNLNNMNMNQFMMNNFNNFNNMNNPMMNNNYNNMMNNMNMNQFMYNMMQMINNMNNNINSNDNINSNNNINNNYNIINIVFMVPQNGINARYLFQANRDEPLCSVVNQYINKTKDYHINMYLFNGHKLDESKKVSEEGIYNGAIINVVRTSDILGAKFR